jgi:shikimate dehydrogenase
MAPSLIPQAAVMGWPVSHSLSPRLHSFWLSKMSIAGSYEALPVEPKDLEAALRGLNDQGLCGVNLTVPHKIAACQIVDRLDPIAKRIGAVNLVTVDRHGKLFGSNTDAYGFTQNLLASGFSGGQGAAFVLGAGGASRAVIVALIDMGFSEIRIANRTKENAEKLAQEFSSNQCKIVTVAWGDASHRLQNIDLLINTTSLGMKGQSPLEFTLGTLPERATVNDIVYSPLETDLLKRARARGHRAIDGLGMLLHQGRPAFKAFFGQDPEVTQELRGYILAGRD